MKPQRKTALPARIVIALALSLIGAPASPAFASMELSLEQAVELAVIHNEDLMKAQEDKLLGRERVKEALSAAIPKISGSYAYSYTIDLEYPASMMGDENGGPEAQAAQYSSGGDSGSSMSSLGLFSFADHSHSFSLTASQTIFDSGRTLFAYRAAKANLSAVTFGFTRKKREVTLAVQESYLNSLMAREALKIARASLENTTKDHEIIRQRLAEGLGSEFEVLQHEVELSNRKTQLITAENNVTLAKNYLKVITGIDRDEEITLTDSYNESFPEFDYAQILAAMQETEPSLKALEKVTDIRLNMWKLNKADRFPFLLGYGSMTYMGYSDGFVPASDDFGHMYMAGVNVSIPLYEGGVKNAKKNQAFRDYNKSKLDLSKTRKLITLDFQNAYLAYQASRREMESARSTVKFAQKAYELAQLRYQTGLGSLTELLDAELAFTESQLFLSKTLRDANLHLYRIRSYLPGDTRSTP